MKYLSKLILLTVFLFTTAAAFGQQKPPKPCSTDAYRQFDFWLGEWNVYSPQGTYQGTNDVKQMHGSCVILENWTGASGGTGQSFNTYDPRTETWSQVWVDSWGQRLDFSGRYEDKQLKYAGFSYNKKGEKVYHKLTFTNNEDGTVRQLWESSKDMRTWQVVFDGLYVKKGSEKDKEFQKSK